MIDALGPHGGYIIASFSVGFVILAWMIGSSLLHLQRAKTRLARFEKEKAEKTP